MNSWEMRMCMCKAAKSCWTRARSVISAKIQDCCNDELLIVPLNWIYVGVDQEWLPITSNRLWAHPLCGPAPIDLDVHTTEVTSYCGADQRVSSNCVCRDSESLFGSHWQPNPSPGSASVPLSEPATCPKSCVRSTTFVLCVILDRIDFFTLLICPGITPGSRPYWTKNHFGPCRPSSLLLFSG